VADFEAAFAKAAADQRAIDTEAKRTRRVARSRATAKAAGTKMETAVERTLAQHVDDRIVRRTKTGAVDRGDIANFRVHGERVVIEVKNHAGSVDVAGWLTEAEIERRNDQAAAGMVIAKRARKDNMGEQIVMMTVQDFLFFVNGKRPALSEFPGVEAGFQSTGTPNV
jgi:hypothetical protein